MTRKIIYYYEANRTLYLLSLVYPNKRYKGNAGREIPSGIALVGFAVERLNQRIKSFPTMSSTTTI